MGRTLLSDCTRPWRSNCTAGDCVGWFRVTAVALVLWCGLAGAGLAQSPPASPQPLPKEQFDALVEAVKKAVAEELKAQGPPAKGAPAKPESASPSAADDADKPALLTLFGQDLVKVLAATPVLIDSLADLPKALDESTTGGRGVGSFLLILLPMPLILSGSRSFRQRDARALGCFPAALQSRSLPSLAASSGECATVCHCLADGANVEVLKCEFYRSARGRLPIDEDVWLIFDRKTGE